MESSEENKIFLTLIFGGTTLYDLEGSSIFNASPLGIETLNGVSVVLPATSNKTSEPLPIVPGTIQTKVAQLPATAGLPKINATLTNTNPPQSTISNPNLKLDQPSLSPISIPANPLPTQETLLPIAGKNLKNITVLISLTEENISPSTEVIYKMMSRLQISPDDLFVFNLTNPNPISPSDLQTHFGTKILLAFGVSPARLSGITNAPTNTIYVYKNPQNSQTINMIFMQKTDFIVQYAEVEKRNLWAEIQKLFAV